MAKETDILTKAYKQTEFTEDMNDAINAADTGYKNLTLVLIDVDNFLRVNTDFGHDTGDEVLREIGSVLNGIEHEKSVYRYSGDEFAVIFPDTEKETVFLIMEKIRTQISSIPVCVKTNSTVSMGIASFNDDGTKQAELLRKADGAMYRAKASGRNRICLAKEEKLVTKTAHYTTDQLKRLKILAEFTGTGEAELMREAVDLLLKKYDREKTE